MRICRTVLAAAVLLTLAAATQARPPQAGFTPLGFGQGHFWWTSAFDVSDDGRVVVGQGGRADTADLEAWRWTEGGGIEGLGDLPGWDGGSDHAFESRASGVSGDGKVVVGEGQGYDGDEAVLWTRREGPIGLGFLPSTHTSSSASAASRKGDVIVGSSNSLLGWQAFRWTSRTGMVPLGTLGGTIAESHAADVSADGNVIVGLSYGAAGWEAFRWTPERGMVGLGHLPGATWTQATSVSADGRTVVGYAVIGSTRFEAFRWTAEEGMEGLGDLPGGNVISMASGVSGDGSIVVGASETSNPYGMNDAFIWDREHGMRLLQQVLADEHGLPLTGWKLMRAYAITPDGTCIIGDGTNPQGQHEAWLVRLPRARKALRPMPPTPLPPRPIPRGGPAPAGGPAAARPSR